MELVSSAFQAVGPKLVELDLHVYTDDINRLFDLIIEHCKVLRHFAYEEALVVVDFVALIPKLHTEHLLRLVAGIPSLTSLDLGHHFSVRWQDLVPVVQQLNSLKLCYEVDFDEFVGLLEQFPLLNTLIFTEHKFCRSNGSLQLWRQSATTLDTSELYRCFAACPSIRRLYLSLTLVRGNETAMACIGVTGKLWRVWVCTNSLQMTCHPSKRC